VSAVGEHEAVDAESVAGAERFPAASIASTAKLYEFPHVRPEAVNAVVVVVPTSVPSRRTR
jgi:hypothetical protein